MIDRPSIYIGEMQLRNYHRKINEVLTNEVFRLWALLESQSSRIPITSESSKPPVLAQFKLTCGMLPKARELKINQKEMVTSKVLFGLETLKWPTTTTFVVIRVQKVRWHISMFIFCVGWEKICLKDKN